MCPRYLQIRSFPRVRKLPYVCFHPFHSGQRAKPAIGHDNAIPPPPLVHLQRCGGKRRLRIYGKLPTWPIAEFGGGKTRNWTLIRRGILDILLSSHVLVACSHVHSYSATSLKLVKMKQTDFDAIIVGAGFGGIYQLKRLRDLGLNCRVIDAAGDVGVSWSLLSNMRH